MSLQEKALAVLRENSTYGQALENHCRRLAAFTIAIGQNRGEPLDEDLIFAAAYLHDIGLCVKDEAEKNYLKRGLKFIEPLAREWHLTSEQEHALAEMMLYNHSLTEVPGISLYGELIRRGVQTEHSFGRISNGLARETRRNIFKKYPRLNFNHVLLSFFKTSVLHDGARETMNAFLPLGLKAILSKRRA